MDNQDQNTPFQPVPAEDLTLESLLKMIAETQNQNRIIKQETEGLKTEIEGLKVSMIEMKNSISEKEEMIKKLEKRSYFGPEEDFIVDKELVFDSFPILYFCCTGNRKDQSIFRRQVSEHGNPTITKDHRHRTIISVNENNCSYINFGPNYDWGCDLFVDICLTRNWGESWGEQYHLTVSSPSWSVFISSEGNRYVNGKVLLFVKLTLENGEILEGRVEHTSIMSIKENGKVNFKFSYNGKALKSLIESVKEGTVESVVCRINSEDGLKIPILTFQQGNTTQVKFGGGEKDHYTFVTYQAGLVLPESYLKIFKHSKDNNENEYNSQKLKLFEKRK